MKKTTKADEAPKPLPEIPVTPPIPDEPLKIAVCGTASSSIGEVPVDDKTWKIWSLCFNYNKFKRVDKLFELHDSNVLESAGFDPNAIEALRKYKGDIIVQKRSDMFPEATEFPLKLVLDCFPRRYFTSSIAWMLGLAIMMNPKEIGLWGIDMIDTDEYAHQKGACEYMVGYADAKGIKVTIAKDSPICRTSRLYAFQDVGISRELVIRRRELKNEQNRREQSYLTERDMFHYYKGRYDEADSISNRWR